MRSKDIRGWWRERIQTLEDHPWMVPARNQALEGHPWMVPRTHLGV
jgi:hypothetical protein